uniref:Putative calcitonin-like diuretic hormone prepropeptide variant a rhodnius prolixus n=1 Tax=Xenopsylla cheopis TaxID=163159 RepID=A0A6M2DXI3_XENCH
MQKGGNKIGPIMLVIVMMIAFTSLCEAAPRLHNRLNYYSDMDGEPDPSVVLEMLARLGQTIMRTHDLENTKRGLDLGLSRGYSGSQAAKHLMGLAAANYAGGPGRKKREPMMTE